MSLKGLKLFGLANSLFFFLIQSSAQAEEVVIDGQSYKVIIAVPVQGAPLPEPPPPPPRPKTLEESLADLTEQNRRLAESIQQLSGSIREQTEKQNKAETIYGLGAGVLVTTGQAQLTLDANLKYLFACYYPDKGECLGLMSTIEAGQVRYHPLGIGIFRYDDSDDPLTAEYLPRSWDLMVAMGLDVRLVGNLFFRFQVAWFFPNPFDVVGYAEDRIREDLVEWERRHNVDAAAAREQIDRWDTSAPGDFAEAEAENTKDTARSMERHTGKAWDSYKEAGKKPWFQLALRWEF